MSSHIDAAREFLLAGAIEDLVAEDVETTESVAFCDLDDRVLVWVALAQDRVFSNN